MILSTDKNVRTILYSGGQGGGRPGEKGAGGVREAGEEGAGSGIPKVAGSGRSEHKDTRHINDSVIASITNICLFIG